MARSRKIMRYMLLAVLAVVLTTSGVLRAQDPKIVSSGISMVGGDLETIDPGLAEASSQIEVINQIFVGLTAQDVVTAESGLGLASSYEVSEDGKTFTFTLMDNVPWVRYNAETDAVEEVTDESGAVRYVTADDVKYGMLRSLNPDTASPYSYVLAPYVVGATEYNAGEGSADDVAITVVDATTLEVTQPDAVPFAISIYGLWMARPVPQWTIEENGDAWTEPEFIYTNGPFALKEWAHDESITLVKNPFWPGSTTVPQAKLDEVTLRFLDPGVQFNEYLAGTIDAVQVPVEAIDQVKADATLSAEYVSGGNPCTYYIGFDNTEAPMDNAHLRRAFSFAIDRQSLVDNVTKRDETPAQWFVYPGLQAAPTLETNPDLGVKYDPELAKAELALALEELGLSDVSELPEIPYAYNDSSNHGAIAQAIQQMWTDTLGITVTLSPQDPTTYFSLLSEDAPLVYRAGWCQDYSDANNFDYDVFYSASSQNDTGFVDATYDEIVSKARTESDIDVRRDLYAQAEQILVVDKAAIAPTHWYTLNLLVKPGVERAPSVTGNEAYYLWDKS
ncbi:MAG: peptide ABC transporter substrate-binding protein [Chloroflexi bacterium]|nr:peptide ABC transporter substrate-binding protein [Chloroflexota bacterium]MCC6891572.1 peptide ABC transporter substrate-binding protein [Anaerolineae bacterium]